MIEPSSTRRKAKASPVSPMRMRWALLPAWYGMLSTKLCPTSTLCKRAPLTLTAPPQRGGAHDSHPLLIALAAAAALAGCNKENHTIVAGVPTTATTNAASQRRRSRCRRRSPPASLSLRRQQASSTSTGCRTASRRTSAPKKAAPTQVGAEAGQPMTGRTAIARRATPTASAKIATYKRRRAARPELSLTSLSAALDQGGRGGMSPMHISRRAFTGGALEPRARQPAPGARVRARRRGLAAGARRDPRLWRSAPALFRPARDDARADHARRLLDRPRTSALPMRDARTPITPDTLFQIGSISKLMTAACSTSSPPKDGFS